MEVLVMLFIVQKTSCDVLLLLELLLPVMASRARLQCSVWVMIGGCCWREKKWRKGAGWDGDEDESYLARVLAYGGFCQDCISGIWFSEYLSCRW